MAIQSKNAVKGTVKLPKKYKVKIGLYTGNGKPEFSIMNANMQCDDLIVYRGTARIDVDDEFRNIDGIECRKSEGE